MNATQRYDLQFAGFVVVVVVVVVVVGLSPCLAGWLAPGMPRFSSVGGFF